ncbi:YibE/F family protein [Jiangella mangrovi]|uniref:Putative membrane protein n=1 Tax=Jiangella mangrovi TaxID=1524084 RepID=A0A7W9LQ55_9ACTN|nr:putative membrane protein [Jiangella mangrovi]
MSAVHLHSTEPAPPAGPHVRNLVLAVLIPLILATIAGLVVLWPSGETPSIEAGVRTDGTILAVEPCEDVVDTPPTPEGEDTAGECLQARVRVDAGPDEGIETIVPLPFGLGAPEFHEGDEVVLSALPDAPLESRYEVLDFQRSVPLLWLAGLFAVAVVVLSGWKGLAALGGLGVTMVVLLVFVLPALLTGESPLPVAVVGASLIMIVTLYLAHGLSIRTSVALIGTLVSLALTGLLGSLFTSVAHFTGLAGEAASYLGTVNTEIDLRGLLLAGLVIGALGVLDDVTVTQSAAVWELAAADPSSSRRSLLAAGLRIGREHVAATVNTLVLAYVGAALPLLMLFSVAGQGVTDVLTTEAVAQEIVRALVGGLGIIAAVPVTTALAVLAVRGRSARPAGRRRKPTSSTLEA